MSNSKELSFADFLAEDELRRMNNERRRKNMRRERVTKEAREEGRLLRMKDLVEDLKTIEDHIHEQSSSLARMKVNLIAVQLKLERLITEESPAPKRKRTSKKKRFWKPLKINREEFLKK